MDGIFAAAAAELGGGQSVNRFLQTWGGARHATSSSSGAASSSSGAAASLAAVTHPRDGLQRYSKEEWDAKVERYRNDQFQQYSKEEWAAWHSDGPKRKEAKVDKTEEEEVAKEKEVAKEEVANEEEVAKEEDVAKEEAEEEAREEKQVLAAHDPYELSSEDEDSLEALRKRLHDAQPNPEPRDNRQRPRGGQSREYWQGFYDGRASRWQEEAEEEDVAKEEAKSFGINEPPPPFHVYRLQTPPPPPPPPPIPQPSEAAREAAAVAEFDRRVFGGK